MHKIFTDFLLLITIFSFLGCSNLSKEEILKEELRTENNISKNPRSDKPAIETIEVSAENFNITNLSLPKTEKIKRVKILGAKLDDVIALLTEATKQNIIFQTQSDMARTNTANNTNTVDLVNSENDVRESKVFVSASNIGFSRLLKKTIGDKLSIRYADNTYYLGFLKTVTLKIPSLKGLPELITATLNTLGAVSVVHDTITSTVTFSAREKEYQDIMKYLTILRNNLYVIEYDIAIYDVALKDNYSLGIDWNIISSKTGSLGFQSTAQSSFGSVAAAAAPATFGTILNTSMFSGSVMAEALSQFGKVESIQKPKLLGIAGTDVVLVDGLEEPYIKELKTTAVGDKGVQTSTISALALSGLKVTLNSNIMDGTILTDISLQINDIVGYSNFQVDGNSYSQPKIHTKNIKNSMRVQPGVPIVISGLFRHKSDKGYKGIPGLAETKARMVGGSEYDSNTKNEMVIVVTPRVIKYVMK